MRGWIAPLIKLVTFLVITAIFTYILGATIANESFGSTHTYKADFTDVTGLNQGDDVRIAGVRVGTVGSIQILPRPGETSVAQVTFTVQKSRSLPSSATATLRYRNLVGQRYIDVERGPGNTNKILKPGGTIPLNQTRPAVDLTVLFEGFQPLVQGLNPTQINDLTLEVIKTLQGEGGALQLLLANVADLTNTLADKDKVIGEVIDNLTSVLTAVGKRDSELSNLIVELKDFVSGLAGDRTTIGNAIVGINRLATNTSSLLTQVRPPLKSDITAITALANVLNRNSKTIKYVVNQIPPTVAGLIRTASYGSWFNFYLCSLSGEIGLTSTQGVDLGLLPITKGQTPARCS